MRDIVGNKVRGQGQGQRNARIGNSGGDCCADENMRKFKHVL